MKPKNVKRVLLFLGLTFSLTWGFEWVVARTIGPAAYLATQMTPLGMFFPACSAILLQCFVFRDSPVYFRAPADPARWVFFGFLILAGAYAALTFLALSTAIRPLILQGIGGILIMFWTFLLFYLHGKSGEEGFARIGLPLGDPSLGVRFIAGTAAFFILQSALNLLFGLGELPGVQETVGGVPVPAGVYPFALIVFFGITVVGVPLTGLAAVFGEEYGWRGFLQKELAALGRRRGVLLTGLIWGIWHFPVILGGIHTYPPDAAGLLMGLVFFTLAGCVLGYAVIKTGSIWVAAFMHGVMNSVYAFGLQYLARPDDKLLSFGLGAGGLLCLAAIVLWIMRDPVWNAAAEGGGG